MAEKNICIGVDPGLSSTGIIVLNPEGKLWGSVNVTHTIYKPMKKRVPPTGKFKAAFIDKPKELKTPQSIKYNYPLDDNGDLRQVLMYYQIMKDVFEILPILIEKEFGVCRYRIGLEIPFGHHKGAGAKIDRMFAIAILAIVNAATMKIQLGGWDVYNVHSLEMKKFVTGKGNCKKELLVKEVFKRFDFDTDIIDLADAFGVVKLLEHRIKESAKHEK